MVEIPFGRSAKGSLARLSAKRCRRRTISKRSPEGFRSAKASRLATPYRIAVLLGFCTAVAAPSQAQPRYLYYLHGKVVEDRGPKGVDPRFGAYDLPGIVKAFRGAGFEVLAEVRPRDTDVSQYADKIVGLIRQQIRGGVLPSHITVTGASKGSVIAALISSRLKEPEVRYVLLANCNDWLIRTWDPHLTGKVLSIYETSDDIGHSCKPTIARSPGVTRFAELSLSTGLGHGVVYRPLPLWVKPAVKWAKQP